MLRLAGYSASRSVCARGGRSAGRAVLLECLAFGLRLPCGSVGMSGVWFTPAVRFCWNVLRSVHACRAVLLGCLAFGSRLPCGSVGMSCVRFTPAVRFCWDVWRSVHACRAVLLGCLAFGSRLPCGSVGMSCVWFTPVSFPLSGKERRLAVSSVPIPPGRDRHSCVLAASFGYLPWLVHFGFARFFMAIPTGLPGTRGTRNGVTKERGWRRGLCALLRGRIGLAVFSAGSTLGLRAPDCAKESSTLWTLFF